MSSHKIAIALLLVLLSSCSIFPPRPDPNFFTLSPKSDEETSRMARSGPPMISYRAVRVGLGPIKFPEYLDRLELVSRIDDNRIVISTSDRWAEPLDTSFEKILARDLSSQLPNSEISIYPWYGNRLPNLQIVLDVQRFDVNTEGLAQLEVTWAIVDPKAQAALYSTTSAVRVSAEGSDPKDAVAALSCTIADLSSQIALNATRVNLARSGGDR